MIVSDTFVMSDDLLEDFTSDIISDFVLYLRQIKLTALLLKISV